MANTVLKRKFLKFLSEEEQEEEDLKVLMTLLKKRKHNFWVHPILEKRKNFGVYYHLVEELALDTNKFSGYLRLNAAQLEEILTYVRPSLHKKTVTREPISEKQRLVICLR